MGALLCVIAMLAPTQSHSQISALKPISQAEWQALLGPGSQNFSSAELLSLSTKASAEASNFAASGNRDGAFAATLKAISLSKGGQALSADKTSEEWTRNQAAARQLAEVLLSVGVPESVLDRSLENLLAVLAPTRQSKPQSNRPIAVTGGEQAKIRAAVREVLNDPESGRFGALSLVRSDRACQTVNAKNKFGGYTGDQQAMVLKLEGRWYALHVADVSHDQCLTVVKDMDKPNPYRPITPGTDTQQTISPSKLQD